MKPKNSEMPFDNESFAVDVQQGWKGRFSLTKTLSITIGLLVLISVSSVLGVGVWLAQKNTYSLLGDKVNEFTSSSVNRVKHHLQSAEYQAQFIVSRLEKGEVDLTNTDQFGILLMGALAAAPQIEAVMFIDPAKQSLIAFWEDNEVIVAQRDLSDDSAVRQAMSGGQSDSGWGAPVWHEGTNETFLNLSVPVVLEGKPMGFIVSVVSVDELSTFISDEEQRDDGRAFILYGRDHVLAHWLIQRTYPGRSSNSPLPLLKNFGDIILSSIWQTEGRYETPLQFSNGSKGHSLEIHDEQYMFVYRSVSGFGPKPIIVGAYFNAIDVTEEISRMVLSLVTGLIALVVSLLAAIFLGRKIAKPIIEFSSAASRVRDLKISEVPNLHGSIYRELNDHARSFNAMLKALRWFELYVPRRVVERLIKRDEVDSIISETGEVTVMFTDIVGFSTTSQGMSAPQVAEFVNHHFTLVAACIESENGIVDKFIGDSVMAFWDASDSDEESAVQACRASLAIAKAIAEDNQRVGEKGFPAIAIRIGIHTGNATVGNIGAVGRINYTIIGDTVNVSQRLEQLGKIIYPLGTTTSILISGDTAAKLNGEFNMVSVGRRFLKGRTGDIEVFKLE